MASSLCGASRCGQAWEHTDLVGRVLDATAHINEHRGAAGVDTLGPALINGFKHQTLLPRRARERTAGCSIMFFHNVLGLDAQRHLRRPCKFMPQTAPMNCNDVESLSAMRHSMILGVYDRLPHLIAVTLQLRDDLIEHPWVTGLQPFDVFLRGYQKLATSA